MKKTPNRNILALLLALALVLGAFPTLLVSAAGGNAYNHYKYQLSTEQQSVYAALETAVPGQVNTLTVPQAQLGLSGETWATEDDFNAALEDSLYMAMDAWYYDNPMAYWFPWDEQSQSISIGLSLGQSGYFVDGDLTIAVTTAAADADADAWIADLAANASGTVPEKLRSVYDVLADIAYDDRYNTGTAAAESFEITGAYNGLAVCEGYSKSFKAVCDILGIPCVLVPGNLQVDATAASGPHMWNLVRLADADGSTAWYVVDIANDVFLAGQNTAFVTTTIGDALQPDFAYGFTVPTPLADDAYEPEEETTTEATDDTTEATDDTTEATDDTTSPTGGATDPTQPTKSEKEDRDNSSGGGSGTKDPTEPQWGGLRNNTPAPVTSAQATKAAETAVAAAVAAGKDTASVRLKNPSTITADAFQAIAKAAGDLPVKLQADSLSADGKSVEVRIALDPAKATGDLNLSASTSNADAKKAKAKFAKHFENDLQVVSCAQKGSFGQPVEMAIKMELSADDLENLVVYSYDSATNTFTKVKNPGCWVDKNGYLRFTTELAGDIIVSAGPLSQK